jgi:hypothetical protein
MSSCTVILVLQFSILRFAVQEIVFGQEDCNCLPNLSGEAIPVLLNCLYLEWWDGVQFRIDSASLMCSIECSAKYLLVSPNYTPSLLEDFLTPSLSWGFDPTYLSGVSATNSPPSSSSLMDLSSSSLVVAVTGEFYYTIAGGQIKGL